VRFVGDLYEEIVDALNALHGSHAGHRAAHAKGTFWAGSFTAGPDAARLTRAAHMSGDAVPATVRFSNGSGNPDAPDNDRREGRGMATKFHLPDGSETDIVAITIPVFFVRTPEDFLEFVRARVPDPETGEIDMEKVGAFIGAHPETQEAVQLILPALAPPVSYATCAYNSLHAFAFESESGERRFGRYRWEPEAGEAALAEDEIEGKDADYLQDEIAERIASGPVAFTLTVQLAGEGDPTDDPTVRWPDDRPWVALGRLELTEPHPGERDGDLLVFDPTRVTDGIECSEDRILAARPRAYSVSVERRSAAAAS
jgi:catalase